MNKKILFAALCSTVGVAEAQTIGRSSINAIGSSSTKGSMSINQSVGQPSIVTVGNSDNIHLRQGFQQPIYFIVENNDLNVSVFPNPTNANFFFEIMETDLENVNYVIYDANGKIVQESITSSLLKNEVNLSNENAGMYFLKISSENRNSTFKVNLIK